MITIGRIYDAPADPDATRVLVDRLWPRGVRKDGAPWDRWMKDVAPSHALRTWYHTHPDEVEEFRRRYRVELADEVHRKAVADLADLCRTRPVILLTATRDVERSQLPVLRDELMALGIPNRAT